MLQNVHLHILQNTLCGLQKEKVGNLITKVVKGLSENSNDNSKIELEVRKEVVDLCAKFPIYNHLSRN